ncbi:hypothetical protein HanIR_Chr12g0593781 [Helianthus annuus]|nr:hypothetical protein HanIR_Chr12g0593781 [Helianthus annuus]
MLFEGISCLISSCNLMICCLTCLSELGCWLEILPFDLFLYDVCVYGSVTSG